MPDVGRERLQALEEAIFTRRHGTVEEAAAGFSRDDLMDTIREARRVMRAAIVDLPDSAFALRPANDAGEPVWSAGEIAGHIAESMLWLQFALRRLAGELVEGEPGDIPGIDVRDRDSTLALLDRADRELDLARAMANEISDEPNIHIGGLGDVGVRGLLLLHAMHEVGHADQLRALEQG